MDPHERMVVPSHRGFGGGWIVAAKLFLVQPGLVGDRPVGREPVVLLHVLRDREVCRSRVQVRWIGIGSPVFGPTEAVSQYFAGKPIWMRTCLLYTSPSPRDRG